MSTLEAAPRRPRAALVALVTSFLVVLSGLFVAPAASAAPGAALQATEAPRAGGTVTISGSGFDPTDTQPGIYLGLGPAGLTGFYAGSSSLLDIVWVGPKNETGTSDQGRTAKLEADGTFTTTFTVPAFADGATYAVYSSKAHSGGFSDKSQDATVAIAYEAAPQQAAPTTTTIVPSATSLEAGADLTLTANVEPATEGTVGFFAAGEQIGGALPLADGSATMSTNTLPVGSHEITAVFTPAGTDVLGSTSPATRVTVTEPSTGEPEPEVPAKPSVSASVTNATEAGLTVSATVENITLRSGADVPDSGKDDVGVYIGIIEKDRVNDYRTDSSAGAMQDFAYKTFIRDGRVTRSIEVPAAKLDRTKEYVAVSWLAHGFLSDERALGQADLDVTGAQWKAVFPATISAEVTEASASGLTVTATVSNFVLRAAADVTDTGKKDLGVYLGVIEKERVSEYGTNAAAGALQDFAFIADSATTSVTRTLTVPATKLDRTKEYVVVSWLAHGMLNESRFLAQTGLEVTWPDWDAVFGASAKPTTLTLVSSASSVSDGHQVGLTATLRSAAIESAVVSTPVGTVQFFENGERLGDPVNVSIGKNVTYGTATAASNAVMSGANNSYSAVFTPKDSAKHVASESGIVHVAGTAATGPWQPEIEVFLKIGGVEVPYTGQKVYRGDELVVRGTGFDPEANVGGRGVPVPFGPQGSYVVFGNFDAQGWKPSENKIAATRKATNQGWVLAESVLETVPAAFKPVIEAQWAKPMNGSFEWASGPLTTPATVTNGEFGVYTYAAGGAVNADEELAITIDYVDAVRPGNPAIEVFLADGTTPYTNQELAEGDSLVVKGSGFDPYANQPADQTGGMPIPNTLPQGTFVVFGSFADVWEPSANAPSTARVMNKDSRRWLLAEDTLNAVPAQFRETIRSQWVNLSEDGSFESKLTLKTPAEPLADGNYGIYTYAGGSGQVVNAAQEIAVQVNYDDGLVDGGEAEAGALQWGIKSSFVNYISSAGSVETLGAATRADGVFNFPQISGDAWNAGAGTGEVDYGGGVNFSAHGGALSLSILDPVITVTNATTALLTANVNGTVVPLVDIDLSAGEKSIGADGAVTWKQAATTLRSEATSAFQNYPAGEAFDDITFTIGASSDSGTTDPVDPPVKPNPKPTPAPAPIGGAQQAGALSWGVSAGFKAYATGSIAQGSVTTSGVGSAGGAYLFPQTTGGSWNSGTQTGSVQFSGVVTFSGHHGLMTETFANPVITVTSATTATLNAGGRAFALNLGAATKSVGANGEVSWSGVPVSGTISGSGSTGGGGGGGSFAADPLSFTVGAPSSVQFGSTTQSGQPADREAAATPPATTGITVITPAAKITPGGEIEFEASGFTANERDILVVLYSDPIVLDRKAGANESGTVRWIGTLPTDLELGEHTITLQGSTNAGAVIEVVAPGKVKKTSEVLEANAADGQLLAASAAVAGPNTGPIWLWWVGAGALLVLAAALGGLVVNQRRVASSGGSAAGSGNVDNGIANES